MRIIAILSVSSIQSGMQPSDATPEGLRTLGLGYAMGVLTAWMLMILCVNFYRISRADHEANLKALSERGTA